MCQKIRGILISQFMTPLKSVFLSCCAQTQKKMIITLFMHVCFSESDKFGYETGIAASGGFTTVNEETPSSNGKRVLLLNSTNILILHIKLCLDENIC